MVTANYEQMMFNNATHFGLVDVRLKEMRQADGRNLQPLRVSYTPSMISFPVV